MIIETESGALEDPKPAPPAALEPAGAADVLGRVLLRSRRPADAGLRRRAGRRRPHVARRSSAWDGLLRTAGSGGSATASQRQRWLYHFRNRHGFTDVADAAFDELWAADRAHLGRDRRLSDGAVATSRSADAR